MNKTNKKKYDLEYIKNKQKRIYLNWLKSDFDSIVEPAIKKSGLPISTFIKKAVMEKLERDNLL